MTEGVKVAAFCTAVVLYWLHTLLTFTGQSVMIGAYSMVIKLSEEVMTRLDLSDGALRAEYRKAGHTDVLTLGLAQLASGSRRRGRMH